jgi:hypothetical protein
LSILAIVEFNCWAPANQQISRDPGRIESLSQAKKSTSLSHKPRHLPKTKSQRFSKWVFASSG